MRWISVLSCAFLGCLPLYADTTSGYTIVEDKANLPILNPSIAQQQTRKLRLDNGLEVYLISDPEAESSSAALTVTTGSWENPENAQGIAHYLEHTLFLGTRRYPNAEIDNRDSFHEFVTAHNGRRNASTQELETTYIFSIDDKAYEEGLDRFADFFKEPLFNESKIGDELIIVDQEFARSLNHDSRRLLYLLKAAANPQHPFSGFSAGNKQSLEAVTQSMIRSWYETHYSADKMHLVLYANRSLDDLQGLAIQDFGGIPKRELKPFSTEEPIFTNSAQGHLLAYEPIKDSRELTLMWFLPKELADQQLSKPEDVAAYILGYQGNNSLFAQLKTEGLADALHCSHQDIADHQRFFYIGVDLTAQGLKNYQRVIELCFQAIATLRNQEIPQYVFDDIQQIARIKYQYPSRSEAYETASDHAYVLAHEPLETYPLHTLVIQKFEPDLVHALLNSLTPDRCLYILAAKASQTHLTYNKEDPWIKMPYAQQEIPEATLAAWAAAPPSRIVAMPQHNQLIPTDLSLKTDLKSDPDHPEAIVDNDEGLIYFAADTYYQTPEVSWRFYVLTPHINLAEPDTIVMGNLYVRALQEALDEFKDHAKMAGFQYDVKQEDFGISIAIDGYSDKAHELLGLILNKIKNFKLTEAKFKIYKEASLRDYQNAAFDDPLVVGFEALRNVLYKDFVTAKEKAKALRKVNYSQFNRYAETIFDTTFTRGVMIGNLSANEATEAWHQMQQAFASQPYPVGRDLHKQIGIIPHNEGPLYVEESAKSKGYAAILAAEYLPFSFSGYAYDSILSHILEAAFFAELRTRQKTGYVAYQWNDVIEMTPILFFAVQSSTHEGRDLLSRFELFLEQTLTQLEEGKLISPTRFEEITHAITTATERPPANLPAKCQELFKHAFVYRDFNWKKTYLQALSETSYDGLFEHAQTVLGRKNHRRFAILIHGDNRSIASFEYTKAKHINAFKALISYSSNNDKNDTGVATP